MRLHSSVGRASHWYCRGHVFKSRWSLRLFFWAFFATSCFTTAKIAFSSLPERMESPGGGGRDGNAPQKSPFRYLLSGLFPVDRLLHPSPHIFLFAPFVWISTNARLLVFRSHRLGKSTSTGTSTMAAGEKKLYSYSCCFAGKCETGQTCWPSTEARIIQPNGTSNLKPADVTFLIRYVFHFFTFEFNTSWCD